MIYDVIKCNNLKKSLAISIQTIVIFSEALFKG